MNPFEFSIEGNLVDIHQERVYPARISIKDGFIISLEELSSTKRSDFLLPGLVDAHVHVESSMLIPSEFARLAVQHGTLATVSDPHEIANVLGFNGVLFMLENAAKVPFKFCFGAPSCVPATPFETSGATLNLEETEALLSRPDIHYLSEMMNFPGVLAKDPWVLQKIEAAKIRNKPVDGHAPGLLGKKAHEYAAAGIQTDHECVSLEEALNKIDAGMQILIREGSAARNFEALWPLLISHPQQTMLCSDDKHPDSLVLGHINTLVARAIKNGVPLFHALKAASLNPVRHYRIPLGLLRPGDPADFIRVHDLKTFKTTEAWINGKQIFGNQALPWPSVTEKPINRFHPYAISPSDFHIPVGNPEAKLRVIVPEDGQLITQCRPQTGCIQENAWEASPKDGLWKIATINRYQQAAPALGFISGLGIREGAFAASVAHDSHNVVVAGTNNQDMWKAAMLIREHQGGLSLASGNLTRILPLPFAGLMSDQPGEHMAQAYEEMNALLSAWGCTLASPFMTLSFMALLVIPDLKLSDKGLFDGRKFQFTSLEMSKLD